MEAKKVEVMGILEEKLVVNGQRMALKL